jgi:hypothetical protein
VTVAAIVAAVAAIQRRIQPIGMENMPTLLSQLATASIVSLALVSGAQAAGISSADFSGKKICWDNGSTSVYSRGGKYSNTISGDGTWAVAGGGLSIHTDKYDYVAIIKKLPDGSFHADVSGMTTNGKYCN